MDEGQLAVMPVGRKLSCETKIQSKEVGQLPAMLVGRKQSCETKI